MSAPLGTTFLLPLLQGEKVAPERSEDFGPDEGRPLAPYRLQQVQRQPPPLTGRVALAAEEAPARRGLLSPGKRGRGQNGASVTDA